MPQITPFLWFDTEAEEAAKFYLLEMISDPDPAKAERVMKAMLQMKKIEIAPLKQAYEGKN